MAFWQLLLIITALLLAAISFLWLTFRIEKQSTSKTSDIQKSAMEDVDHIFNEQFREELRNRGRLHFEKIIGENAMFLQQDLRLTTSQLNEYMKVEIKRELIEEFKKYEESISTAKQLAVDAIQKTQEVVEQQRAALEKSLMEQAHEEKQRIIEKFEKDMTEIVNHYLIAAIGNEIDLSSQMDYIFDYLEQNKKAIIEDLRSGT